MLAEPPCLLSFPVAHQTVASSSSLKISWCPCHGVGNFSRGVSHWEACRTVHLFLLAQRHLCPGLMSAPHCPHAHPCPGAVPISAAWLRPLWTQLMPGWMTRTGEGGQGCLGAP